MKLFKKATSLTLALSLIASSGLLLSTSSAKAETVVDLLQQSSLSIAKPSAMQKAYISPGLNLNAKSAGPINVIVQFRNQPIAVGKYAAKMGVNTFSAESTVSSINSQQTSFLQGAADKGLSITKNFTYNTVINGMEITIPSNQIQALADLPEVLSVYENSTYYAIPAPNPTQDQPFIDMEPLNQIGIDYAWNVEKLTGAGVKVGVIDTGVDYKHPDLKDAYKGGYDSFYNRPDPYEEKPDLSNPDNPFEGTYHGTHVAGTIAGRATNPTSEIVQKGVAYEADMYNYKVLGRDDKTGRASGSSAQVIDGIERAVRDGAQVINLSLGADSVKDPNSPDSIAINNAVLAGVVAVVASGNAADSGPYYYSMGSPASACLALLLVPLLVLPKFIQLVFTVH
ncbi:S8 family serine peptidase [Paenibacillus sp. N1-5-1-14]|uniref:S8 family serine peptidase n=1 Tax=Paenibacillus radicibacter TaxID=2972488 RepID=UPI002158DE37|nr:S8 family serine peptidase [Paenibacillus radicibacter]MCR8642793.1 S8 family serine peptidase [Paenibacillus radicibacter]